MHSTVGWGEFHALMTIDFAAIQIDVIYVLVDMMFDDHVTDILKSKSCTWPSHILSIASRFKFLHWHAAAAVHELMPMSQPSLAY